MLRTVLTACLIAIPAGLLSVTAGCLPFEFGPWSQVVLSSSVPQRLSGPRIHEVESNDDPSIANTIIFDGQVQLAGTIGAGNSFDFDVYDLGPAGAGDRAVLDLVAAVGSDVVLGLFDDRFNLLGYVDYSRGVSAPGRIDLVLREPVETLYAVATTRSVSSSDRPYTVGVSLTFGVEIPQPNPQIVVLNFRGARDVRIGRQLPVNVPPFDAATIDSDFAGQTDVIIQSILNNVRKDYAGLDVDFYLAGDPNLPAGDLTIIHFGTYSDRFLGLADNVDPFNRDSTQAAIIYTDTFSLFSVFSPSAEQIAQVLANTTSHELGHLLGLRHTADVNDLMDITATARQMLSDQWHKVADLHSSIMSIGYQDAPTMLSWCVGGAPPAPPADASAKVQQMARMAGDPDDFYVPRDWLATNSAETDDAAEGQADGQ